MAQMIIRNLDDSIKECLKAQAARHGCSMEEEAREILRSALKGKNPKPTQLGSRIADRFQGIGLKAELPEMHGQTILPMGLEE